MESPLIRFHRQFVSCPVAFLMLLAALLLPARLQAQAPACTLESKDPAVCVNPGKEYLGGLGVPKFDLTPGGRSIGMGRAGASLIVDPALVRLNPAALARLKMFSIGGGYQRNADGSDQYNIGVIDSVTTELAAGLYYSMESDAGFGFMGKDIRPPRYSYLSLGIADGYPLFGIPLYAGAAVNWLRTDIPIEGGSDHVVDATFSAHMDPLPNLWNLSAALVGRNLIGTDKERLARNVEITGSIAPLEWLRGAGGVITDLTRSSDLDAGFLVGIEAEPVKELLLRGGVLREPAIRDFLMTMGAGFENPNVSIVFAYQRNLRREANQFTIEFTYRDFGQGGSSGGNYPPNQGPRITDPPRFVPPGGK